MRTRVPLLAGAGSATLIRRQTQQNVRTHDRLQLRAAAVDKLCRRLCGC